jgi:hypothetical protein
VEILKTPILRFIDNWAFFIKLFCFALKCQSWKRLREATR